MERVKVEMYLLAKTREDEGTEAEQRRAIALFLDNLLLMLTQRTIESMQTVDLRKLYATWINEVNRTTVSAANDLVLQRIGVLPDYREVMGINPPDVNVVDIFSRKA